jgi:uncharacterized protein HemY
VADHLDDEQVEAELEVARALASAGNMSGALERVRNLLKANASNPQVFALKAYLELRAGEMRQA